MYSEGIPAASTSNIIATLTRRSHTTSTKLSYMVWLGLYDKGQLLKFWQQCIWYTGISLPASKYHLLVTIGELLGQFIR